MSPYGRPSSWLVSVASRGRTWFSQRRATRAVELDASESEAAAALESEAVGEAVGEDDGPPVPGVCGEVRVRGGLPRARARTTSGTAGSSSQVSGRFCAACAVLTTDRS